MQFLPKRYHRNVFLLSIRPLQLRNPCIPAFEPHVQTIEARLKLPDETSASIGDALDALVADRDDAEEWSYRFALKQVVFGYSLSHGWTFWGHFEQDQKPLLIFRSLIESPSLKICSRFEFATYGSLLFRVTRIDRMDQAVETGEPDYDQRLSTVSELTGILERQTPSAERDAKLKCLKTMERRGDLSNIVRSLSKEARRAMSEKFRSMFEERVVRDENGVQINGTIDEILFVNRATRQGIGGQPSKDPIVIEAFFTWLLSGDFHEGLNKKEVIGRVIATASDLSQSEISGKGVGYRKVEQFFNENSYWHDGEWRSETWRPAFNLWKMQLFGG